MLDRDQHIRERLPGWVGDEVAKAGRGGPDGYAAREWLRLHVAQAQLDSTEALATYARTLNRLTAVLAVATVALAVVGYLNLRVGLGS